MADLLPYKNTKFLNEIPSFILGILYCAIMSGFRILGHILLTNR